MGEFIPDQKVLCRCWIYRSSNFNQFTNCYHTMHVTASIENRIASIISVQVVYYLVLGSNTRALFAAIVASIVASLC